MSEAARTFVAVEPALRPRRERATVRVLLVDPSGRILLFQDSDPNVPGARWWFLPGGGIDEGESELEAVVREIAEETGFAVDVAAVRGPIAGRRVVHGYSDQIVDQRDVFYFLAVPVFDISADGRTEEEALTIQQHRWWTRAEIEHPAETVWPASLLSIWQLIDRPERWPVSLPDVEESSVPAGD